MEMSEHDVQKIAVGLLRKAGVRFFAVPNGGLRSKHTALKLWQEGVEKGVPDLVIIDPPRGTAAQGWVGTVIEVKKAKGGRASPEQLRWIADFGAREWKAHIVYGIADLLDLLCAYEYLDRATCAPFMPQSGAAGGDSTAQAPTGAGPQRAAGPRRRPTGPRTAKPTADTGAAA